MYPVHQSTVSRLYVPSSTIHSQLSVYIQFNNPQSAVCIYLVRQSIVSHLYVPSSSIHSQPSVHTQFIQSSQPAVCMYQVHQSSQLSICTQFTQSTQSGFCMSRVHPVLSQASVCTQFINPQSASLCLYPVHQSTVSHLYVPSSSNTQSAICTYPVHPIHGQPSVYTQFIHV